MKVCNISTKLFQTAQVFYLVHATNKCDENIPFVIAQLFTNAGSVEVNRCLEMKEYNNCTGVV